MGARSRSGRYRVSFLYEGRVYATIEPLKWADAHWLASGAEERGYRATIARVATRCVKAQRVANRAGLRMHRKAAQR